MGALAVAGAFALLLALSRVPGIERVVSWPIGFFGKGLVIHVVFSLVVWFLAVFSMLVSMASAEVSEGDRERLRWLGPAGAALVAVSFPALFLPAFADDSIASLNNYIPVIIHPAYYAGIAVLLLGVACPVVRLLVNVAIGKPARSAFAASMSAGGVIYLVVISCFAIALSLAGGAAPSPIFNEHLFWGGGHVMQFLNSLLMLTGWFILMQVNLGGAASVERPYRFATSFLAVVALAAPLIYRLFPPFDPSQQNAFRYLQFVLGVPSLAVAVPGLLAVISWRRRKGSLPWGEPGFLALVLSPIVFGAGGVMGIMITGADTRTPAHYHGMIAGVNLACMGLILQFILPRIDGWDPRQSMLRWQIALFGVGQLAACVGLFWAGGYGAPRKVAAGTTRLLDGAIAGMYLNGVGALLAVAGGTMFVITVARVMLRTQQRIA